MQKTWMSNALDAESPGCKISLIQKVLDVKCSGCQKAWMPNAQDAKSLSDQMFWMQKVLVFWRSNVLDAKSL
jgi:hypothetical protein